MNDASMSLAKPTQALDMSVFTADEQQQIKDIANQINVEDSQAVVTYGVGAQREISQFSDNILHEVRSKDSGYVGEVLTDMVVKIKDLGVDRLSAGESFIAKIPILGTLVSQIKRFIARYDKLSVQIEKIVDQLDKARMTLLKDITLLDNMYAKNLEYLKNLELHIAAGQLKLKELQEVILPEMKIKAEASQDPMERQKYNDFANFVNRFDKKIHDLLLSRMIAIQAAPQIRMIQNNDQTLVEKIQSSILNTIPLWKNQIVIAITLFRQKKALELQKEVSDTTNELLMKNSEMLKQGTIEVARESERGIVDIETLKKTNADLIATLEETIKIQAEGKSKRRAAEQELVKIETELKEKLISIRG